MSAVSRVVPGFALESDGDPVGVQLKLPGGSLLVFVARAFC
jgi:hypothetical protein